MLRRQLPSPTRSSSPATPGSRARGSPSGSGVSAPQVTGYALDPPTQPNLFDALDLGSRVRHVVADVRDRDRLTAEVQAAQPSVIFHLAAQALVRRAYEEPRETFETNVMGTVNVLEAARACPSVRAVVIVTSDKCYQNPETGRAFRETDPLGGRDPYGASKAAAELVTAAYRESFFANGAAVASVRAGNVIGGGDWAPDRIIPDSVRALVAGEPVVVRNPDAIRPWQHVLEPLSGYLRLGARCCSTSGRRYDGRLELRPDEGAVRPAGALGGRSLPRGVGLRLVDHAGQHRGPAPRGPAAEPRQHQGAGAARVGAGLGPVGRRFAGRPPGTASTTGPLPARARWSNMSSRPTRTTPAPRGCRGPAAVETGRPGDDQARRRGRDTQRDPRAGGPRTTASGTSPPPFDPDRDPVRYAGRVFGEEEMRLLVDASLDFYLTASRFTEEFEAGVADYLGLSDALFVNSGSSANLVALTALTSPKLGERRLKPGDEVITVAAGFPSTVAPIVQNGLVPVFVDVRLGDYNADPEQLRAADLAADAGRSCWRTRSGVPVRSRHGHGPGREARPVARRGQLRRPRLALPRPADRDVRPPRHVVVLPRAPHHDGRGRHGRHRSTRSWPGSPARSATGAATATARAARTTPAASASPSSSAACRTATTTSTSTATSATT